MNNECVDTLCREKLSYLAGLFDGEGSAFIGRTKSPASRTDFQYCSVLRVNMTDSGPVKLFHECFGSSFCILNSRPPNKSCYCWEVSGRKASPVAAQLLPFSHNDRKKAALECVVKFGETILPKTVICNGTPSETQQARELLYNRCRALNATGSSAGNQSPADLELIEALKPKTAQLNFWDE